MENLRLVHDANQKKKRKSTSFYGDRLRLARSLRGHTQKELAEVVTVRAQTVSKLEAEKLEPSESLLLALGEALDFEPEFFGRPVVDEFKVHECSFRHLQSTPRRMLDQALAQGTLLQEAIAQISALVELPQRNVPNIPASDAAEIESAADACREAWGLGLRAPITNTIRLAENVGVLVTRMKGTTAKVGAFSRYSEPPVIVLTPVRECGTRDRWNVAHEIGHLVCHRGQITGDSKTEREADRFAGAFLLPAAVFKDEFQFMTKVDWPHLFEMKRRWKVSGLEILHRSTQLGFLSEISARRLYKQYSWKGWHKGEPYEVPIEQPEMFMLALEVAEREMKQSLAAVVSGFGWRLQSTEEITGLRVAQEPPAPPPNVTLLDEYRKP